MRDDEAKALYRSLLFKWYDRKNAKKDSPGDNCLAIARSVYCAFTFPKCSE